MSEKTTSMDGRTSTGQGTPPRTGPPAKVRRLAWPAGACAVLALLGFPGGAAWGQIEASRDAEAATIAAATAATPQASPPSRTPASSAAPRRHPAKLAHHRTASQPAAHPA